MTGNKDIELYRKLSTFCKELKEKQKFSYKDNLTFDKLHEECYEKIFLKFKEQSIPPKPLKQLKSSYSHETHTI